MNFEYENEKYGYGRGYGRGMRGNGMGMRFGMHGVHRHGFGLKYFILAMASRQKIRGADIMNNIEQLSHGFWRPSPGHVYFELDRLVDEGYLKRSETEEGKYYEITDKGRQAIAEIEEWFPLSSLLERAGTQQAGQEDNKEGIKEKILAEINALEKDASISAEQKRHLEALRELANKLGD
ncbi:MAG: PadR family transcriptional regulator [Candidatus Micrarchaeia archaeon]